LRAAEDIERGRARLAELARQDLERARYEAGRAVRQYDAVKPVNRLVAGVQERRCEGALLYRRRVREDRDRRMSGHASRLMEEERARIETLAMDLPSPWSTATSAADREEMLRSLIERVTFGLEERAEYVSVKIQWAGGSVSRHELLRPVRRYDQMRDFAQWMSRRPKHR
jgi:hypothetical protein